MKHLFSSGEVMYRKNEKELPEGLLVGTCLEYDNVEKDSGFICHGTLDGRDAKVFFTLAEKDFEGVKNRHTLRILMQSDVLLASWKSYEILSIE